eukprot:jgi/Galph1/5923/GphlegSOOS_G4627.1
MKEKQILFIANRWLLPSWFSWKGKNTHSFYFHAVETPPKSPKQFVQILRTSLQQSLRNRCSKILVDIEDSVSLEMEKNFYKERTRREVTRLIIEMFYGTGIPVLVAFPDAKSLQVARNIWGRATHWASFCSLETFKRRGFQSGIGDNKFPEEQVVIAISPKEKQLSVLEQSLVGAGQVLILINPRFYEQKEPHLSSLQSLVGRYTPVVVLRRLVTEKKRFLLYTRYPSEWNIFLIEPKSCLLVHQCKELPKNIIMLLHRVEKSREMPKTFLGLKWPCWFLPSSDPLCSSGSSVGIPSGKSPQRKGPTQSPSRRNVNAVKKPFPAKNDSSSTTPVQRELLLQAAEKRQQELQSRGIPSSGKSRYTPSRTPVRNNADDGPDIKDWLN